MSNGENDDMDERLAQLQQQAAESGASRLDSAASSTQPEDGAESDEDPNEAPTPPDEETNDTGGDSSPPEDDTDTEQSDPDEDPDPDRTFEEIIDHEMASTDDPHLSTWSPKYAPLMHAIDADHPESERLRNQLREFLADEMDIAIDDIGDSKSGLIEAAIRYLLYRAEHDDRGDARQKLAEARAREAMKDI